MKQCPACRGAKKVLMIGKREPQPCPRCQGKGEVEEDEG